MSAETERSAERLQIEADCTALRISELYMSPVGGRFDLAHLREINRRIFQDLPAAGFEDVQPGAFRKPAPAGRDWIKDRKLEGLNIIAHVAYSPMDKQAQKRLDQVLGQIDVAKMSKLKTAAFTRAIGKLYTELDYLHPFPDGNSRTLREFTRELAEACGYNLDWTRFARTPDGRNALYVARDLGVNALALPALRDPGSTRLVAFTLDRLEGNAGLQDLLKDAVLPGRAIAFRQLKEQDALAAFPDLADAYKTMRLAETYARKELPADAAIRREFLDTVRATIVDRLDAGETTGFRQKERSWGRTPAQASRETKDADRER